MNSMCYGSNYSYTSNDTNTISYNSENGYSQSAVATAGVMTEKDFTKPLHVDCSVEYDLPNQPNPPKKSEPLLMIHPSYYRRAESQSYKIFTNNMPGTVTSLHACGIPQEVTHSCPVQAPARVTIGPAGPAVSASQQFHSHSYSQQNSLQLCSQNTAAWNSGGGLAQTFAYRGNRRVQGPYKCPDRTLQTHNTLQVHNSARSTLQTQNTLQVQNVPQSCAGGYSSGSDSGVSGHWTDTDRSPLAPELRLTRDFPAQPDSGLGTPVSEELRYSFYDKSSHIISTELMNVCDGGSVGATRPAPHDPGPRCFCCGAPEPPPNRPAKRPCGESRSLTSTLTGQQTLMGSTVLHNSLKHPCQQRHTNNAQSNFISPHQSVPGNHNQLKTSTNQNHNLATTTVTMQRHRGMGPTENACKMGTDSSLQMIPGYPKQWSLEVNGTNLWSNPVQASATTGKAPAYCSSMCMICSNTPLNIDNLGNSSSHFVPHSGEYQLSHLYSHGNCRSFSGDASPALWNKENMLRLFQV